MSKVVIDELVKARLSTLVKDGVEGGWLVGLFVDGVPHVFGVLGCAERNDAEESAHIQRMLPVGVQLCGIWVSAEPSAATMVDYLLEMKEKATPDVSDMANVWGGRLWTFWLQQEVEGGGWAATSIDEQAGFQPRQLQLSWTSFQQAPLLPAELQPACFPLLFTADVTLNVFTDAEAAADAEVAAAVGDAAARASKALDATDTFLLSSRDWGRDWGQASGVLLNRSEADSRPLSSCGASGTFQDPSRLQPVGSGSAADQGEAAAPAPAFAYAHRAASALAWSVPVALGVVVLAPTSVAPSRLLQRLVLPVARLQLAAAAAVLKRIPPKHWPLLQLQACHYQPQAFLAHRVSAMVPVARPDGAADAPAKELEELAGLGVEMRVEMHRRLGLPLDRPLLRPEAAVSAAGAPSALAALSAGGRLRDVHEGVRPSGVAGGVQYMVDGSYFYFHYMQDSFDDNGWGCAYRSLQTLWSWFFLQGYTQQAVPGIRSIQKLLVEADPSTTSSLIGSKQWLGSIELATVLQHSLGLDYRIIFVPSGAGMAGKAREIATHFSQAGTPIMVGGGVLAYTLLGIDWNESTGEVAFLILDPHYTGQDDIKKVHKGSWVSWKRPGDKAAAGGDLFVTSSHYNLLCPQRPSTV